MLCVHARTCSCTRQTSLHSSHLRQHPPTGCLLLFEHASSNISRACPRLYEAGLQQQDAHSRERYATQRAVVAGPSLSPGQARRRHHHLVESAVTLCQTSLGLLLPPPHPAALSLALCLDRPHAACPGDARIPLFMSPARVRLWLVAEEQRQVLCDAARQAGGGRRAAGGCRHSWSCRCAPQPWPGAS